MSETLNTGRIDVESEVYIGTGILVVATPRGELQAQPHDLIIQLPGGQYVLDPVSAEALFEGVQYPEAVQARVDEIQELRIQRPDNTLPEPERPAFPGGIRTDLIDPQGENESDEDYQKRLDGEREKARERIAKERERVKEEKAKEREERRLRPDNSLPERGSVGSVGALGMQTAPGSRGEQPTQLPADERRDKDRELPRDPSRPDQGLPPGFPPKPDQGLPEPEKPVRPDHELPKPGDPDFGKPRPEPKKK